MITIQITEPLVQVGSAVHGTIVWDAPSALPQEFIVTATWRTEGRGDINRGSLGTQRICSGPSTPFAFDIPAEGPLSYDGKLIRIIWEITATAHTPTPPAAKAVQSFRVGVRTR